MGGGGRRSGSRAGEDFFGGIAPVVNSEAETDGVLGLLAAAQRP